MIQRVVRSLGAAFAWVPPNAAVDAAVALAVVRNPRRLVKFIGRLGKVER
jgi:hypothetical protein